MMEILECYHYSKYVLVFSQGGSDGLGCLIGVWVLVKAFKVFTIDFSINVARNSLYLNVTPLFGHVKDKLKLIV